MPDDADPPWLFDLHDDDQGIPRTLAEGRSTRAFAGERSRLSAVRVEPHAEGECGRVQGGEEVRATAGDFWHTPGGVEHAVRTGETGALVLDV